MNRKFVDMVLLFDFYGNMLTDKQKDFFDLYYNEDLSLSEIAENEGITRQGVRDAIVRAENILTEFESKLGLYKKYGNIDDGLSDIMGLALEIRRINSTNFLSNTIDDLVRDIIERIRDITDDAQTK